MGSSWSKIWGSGPDPKSGTPCQCGLGWIANCHCCSLLSPQCCQTCKIGLDSHIWQCLYIAADVFIIIIAGIVLVALSDLLVGDEEGLNLFDDLAEFVESGIKAILSGWKNTMGEVHSTLYNLFNTTLKASSALSKLVAATATIGLTLSLMDIFAGRLSKLKGTCIAAMFDAWDTPINFIKAELYGFYKPLGYIADVFLFPFEIVMAFAAMITLAIWDVLKVIDIGKLICGQSQSPCCNDV